jgi:ketosteroid isomerase-like protein
MGKPGDIVRGVYAALGKGDMPSVLAAFDPQIQWREADNFLYADRNPYLGPQAVVEGVFQRLGADLDNFVVVPEHFIEGADAVVVEGRYKAMMKATGAKIDAQFAHVWGVRDGKIVRFQQYTDTKQWDHAARRVTNL